MVYATIDDLAARWRPLNPGEEETRAGVLLEDAAVRIDAAKPPASPAIDLPARLIVSCEMVKRALLTNPDQPAAVSTTQSAGPWSSGITYANPTGDLYLSKADRSLLGISRQRAGSVDLAAGPAA